MRKNQKKPRRSSRGPGAGKLSVGGKKTKKGVGWGMFQGEGQSGGAKLGGKSRGDQKIRGLTDLGENQKKKRSNPRVRGKGKEAGGQRGGTGKERLGGVQFDMYCERQPRGQR